MPCSYHIDTARGVLFIRAWGALTDDEVTAAGAAIRDDPRFSRQHVRIENLLDVTDFKVSRALVQATAQIHEMTPHPRRVFIVSSDAVYGMVRMFELYANAAPDTFLVCRDLATAFRWVGLDPAEGWPADTFSHARSV